MWKNYFKIASRNLSRNRAYTFINIFGLSLGLASAMLIFLFILQYFSFDDFLSKREQLHRIVFKDNRPEISESQSKSPHVPYAFAPALRLEYPTLKFTQIRYQEGLGINFGGRKFMEDETIFADEYFFQLLDYPFLIGDPETALKAPDAIVLEESIAKKYFGTVENAIDKVIKIDNRVPVRVTGVIQDVPAHSHLDFQIVISFGSFEEYFGFDIEKAWNWTSNGLTYVWLPENYPQENLESQFKDFQKRHQNEKWINNRDFHLLALSKVPFNPDYSVNRGKAVSPDFLWGLTLVGLVILLVASINYINLSTAQSVKRSKEIGLKKVMGSSRRDIIFQFFGETLILILISSLLAIALLEASIPFVNKVLSNPIEINIWTNGYFWLGLLLMIFGVCLASGFYPAMVLSGLKPIAALKNKINTHQKGTLYLRRTLVIFQFGIAQALIIITIVMMSQMNYFLNKDLGLNEEAVLLIDIPSDSTDMYYDSNHQQDLTELRNRLNENPNILSHAVMMNPAISNSYYTTYYQMPNSSQPDADYSLDIQYADSNFINIFELELIAGENFSKLYRKDTLRRPILVNESFIQTIGIQNPDEAIGLMPEIDGTPTTIIGVLKNYHIHSLHEEIAPIAILNRPLQWRQIAIKINIEESKAVISDLEKLWQERFPNLFFECDFLDERITRLYEEESQMQYIFQIFAIVAIVISCLGLYGLVSFIASQKIKEIGIRKVLGATVTQILFLFSKEFTRLVIIAFVLATPVSYFLIQKWLEDFAYKINIGLGIFILTIVGSLLIAWLTVGYISLRAARLNPVEVLKDE